MQSQTIEMAALGRAMHPGTLYNCRTDCVVPGDSLWDRETIQKGMDSRRQPKTDLNISASDSLEEKGKLLEVSASLSASFLGGLVEVGGAAKYLRDNKTSARQSRVSLQYSQTTRFEQLTMDQLGNITKPQVFEDGIATHIITAVLYGAQAFMVFDLAANENEDKEEIEGNLSVMIDKIPSLAIAGSGAVAMSESEKKLAESIQCTFYGDYELEKNPTTYLEALDVYRNLPALMREREDNAVAIKVWLYPLSRLSEKAAKLERDIHKTLISKTEALLEELKNAELQINDMITSTTLQDFQEVKLRLQKFKNMLDDYKVKFLRAFNELLPAIRGGKAQEQSLADIITIHEKSPFRAEKLNRWLENSQGEINLLSLYTQQLSDIPVIKSSGLRNIHRTPGVDTVVCFCFTSLSDEDTYLTTLNTFLKAVDFKNLSSVPELADHDIEIWFHKPEVTEKMKDKLFLFKGFSQANKTEKNIRFVIMSISDDVNPGISIQLYKKGRLVNSAFQPVSKPPAPEVSAQDTNIILKLQKPQTGSTVRFRVEYRTTHATHSGADVEKWEVIETPDAQENFTLTGLRLTKQYRFRYRAVSDVGASEQSDSILFTAHGKYKFSLEQIWDWHNTSFITTLRHKIMSTLDSSRWSPSPIKPVVKNVATNLEIPYELGISQGMQTGLAFHFHGVVPEDSASFNIKFKTEKGDDADVAYVLSIFPGYASHQAIMLGGKYDKKGWIVGCPILNGAEFNIVIALEDESYVVYVDSWRYSLFKHSIPVNNVKALLINGDVMIKSLGLAKDWSKSAFGNEPRSGISRLELSRNVLDYTEPVCNPDQPHVGQIPGGLKFGQTFFFQGMVPSDGTGFEINFKAGPHDGDDVAFQFRAEPHTVVCNWSRTGQWGNPNTTEQAIFAKGEGFDIIIIIDPKGYEVTVNGRELCKFAHSTAVENVTTLQITGDVLMNTCAIINVDKFNLTCDLSAHV